MKRLSQSRSSNFCPKLRKNALLIGQSYFSNFVLHMIKRKIAPCCVLRGQRGEVPKMKSDPCFILKSILRFLPISVRHLNLHNKLNLPDQARSCILHLVASKRNIQMVYKFRKHVSCFFAQGGNVGVWEFK